MLRDFELQSSLYSRRVKKKHSEISVEYPGGHPIHRYLKSQYQSSLYSRRVKKKHSEISVEYPGGHPIHRYLKSQ
jgi:hypothetical protein